ncbi:MAG: hypothetical protein ACFFD2_28750 [Promethearchaeota archaeon]
MENDEKKRKKLMEKIDVIIKNIENQNTQINGTQRDLREIKDQNNQIQEAAEQWRMVLNDPNVPNQFFT